MFCGRGREEIKALLAGSVSQQSVTGELTGVPVVKLRVIRGESSSTISFLADSSCRCSSTFERMAVAKLELEHAVHSVRGQMRLPPARKVMIVATDGNSSARTYHYICRRGELECVGAGAGTS